VRIEDAELHITAKILAKRGTSQFESKATYLGKGNFSDLADEHANLSLEADSGTGAEQEMSLGKLWTTLTRKRNPF
jgi:hypothetical protein